MILPGMDRKKGAMSIIRRMKGAPSDLSPDMKKIQGHAEASEEVVDDSSMGLDAAVDELMSAIESKNKSGIKEALKSFITLCADESEC